MLGFTSVYREGFEVVIFLQSIRLQVGTLTVLEGATIGVFLTLIIGVLTFIGHHRLPYKNMLILTGILLGGVLVVMVGESVQEMQLAAWIGTTALAFPIPTWMGVSFAISRTSKAWQHKFLLLCWWLVHIMQPSTCESGDHAGMVESCPARNRSANRETVTDSYYNGWKWELQLVMRHLIG